MNGGGGPQTLNRLMISCIPNNLKYDLITVDFWQAQNEIFTK